MVILVTPTVEIFDLATLMVLRFSAWTMHGEYHEPSTIVSGSDK